ncbi:MAG TPA: Uma2 family endonuclease [Gemmataceae bacterium]|nr:Uma2 family endonuclease [Gemmataceae bacterium]
MSAVPKLQLEQVKNLFTVDQYLAMERASQERHIYLDGEVYLMAGESDEHGDVSVNTILSLGNQLKGKPCRLRTKDTKVRSGPVPMTGRGTRGMFSYPDIVVVCGEREFHDAYKDVILNPKCIVEVLSPSTEAFDRGEKCTRYQTWNPTLTDYLLVSQDKPQVEHYSRQQDGIWSFRRSIGLDAIVEIPSIGCTLRLADIYDGVAFGELPTEEM